MTAVMWGNMTVTTNVGTKQAETDNLGEVSLCTAVILGVTDAKATVLTMATARHCVRDTVEADPFGGNDLLHIDLTRVQFFNGDEGRIEHIWSSPDDDLALITVHTKRSHPLETIRGHEVHRGERLFVFGGPDDMLWSLQNAMSLQGMQPPNFAPQYSRWYRTFAIECAACGPGDSGAGVWNTQGHLVGILVAGNGTATFVEPVALLPTATPIPRGPFGL